ncbi:Paraspeckle component 1 [Anabarilius grahami]|uniref:Paraspeckle component 1 n=1 Tax=Anabarilius grahami TaxID=495550 RepID=A0A3N0Y945_ANAGA|nr:Paraspeckle component 1 [Anabarilius grahami]
MCSLTEFELYMLRHEEERRRREEDMMRHREHLDMRRQPDGFKPSFVESRFDKIIYQERIKEINLANASCFDDIKSRDCPSLNASAQSNASSRYSFNPVAAVSSNQGPSQMMGIAGRVGAMGSSNMGTHLIPDNGLTHNERFSEGGALPMGSPVGGRTGVDSPQQQQHSPMVVGAGPVPGVWWPTISAGGAGLPLVVNSLEHEELDDAELLEHREGTRSLEHADEEFKESSSNMPRVLQPSATDTPLSECPGIQFKEDSPSSQITPEFQDNQITSEFKDSQCTLEYKRRTECPASQHPLECLGSQFNMGCCPSYPISVSSWTGSPVSSHIAQCSQSPGPPATGFGRSTQPEECSYSQPGSRSPLPTTASKKTS